MKKVVVSVTNDLVTDQRVKRSIEVLQELGFEVTFAGRLLPHSLPLQRKYKCVRFRLWFTRGFLFYAAYNLRLFFFLLGNKYDLYLSNDLDTLLPNYLVSRWRKKPLIYDSHEYFTGVPEIQDRPFVKFVWTSLERWIVPRLENFITVNDSIARLYFEDYGKKPWVVRNISDTFLPAKVKSRKELGLPEHAFILINQGTGINIDRGMEEALEALPLLENTILLLVGRGDVYPLLQQKALGEGLEDKVIFVGPQPYEEMLQYTLNADCGLSLDKDTNLNYRYSLPNKLFDYIKCGIPVVASRVAEVRALVEEYGLGEVAEDHRSITIAGAIEKVRSAGREAYRENIQRAARENNWEKEREILRKVFAKYSASGRDTRSYRH